MDRRVTLNRLPAGVTFPAELADRISYEPEARELRFRGFMSKADFDRLARLHEDWGYRRALEDLFRACTLAPDPRPRNRLVAALARLVPALRHDGE